MYTSMHEDVAIIIPSRLGSTRLLEKPLQLIGNRTMIEHVISSVMSAGIENTYVATDSKAIIDKVVSNGGKYIFVDDECNTGTDRVYKAFLKIPGAEKINYVLNVQGDMPFVKPQVIIDVIERLKNSNYDILTPVVKVGLDVVAGDSNVKVVVGSNERALYFSRSLIPYGAKEFLYHVGIYGFRKASLDAFVKLPQSDLEKSEKLEQLRALENNMQIGVCYTDEIPISVDTSEDLNKAIEFYYNSHHNMC